ncbi:MAG TPA: tetratricopeptide repeat protein [Candidatus Binataceae bacterium]|nr:tetratricopeptide repeat protein [Candidatus Binataceae bacterium]
MSLRIDCRHRLGALAFTLALIVAWAGYACAQSLGELNRRLDALQPQVEEGLSSPEVASGVITQLDAAESAFGEIADDSRNKAALLDTYERLEPMLNRMYTTYQRKKDQCIEVINNGGNCDYDEPEQLALRALYPLSWLWYEGASLYSDEPGTARRLLNQAVDGFTDSTLLIVSPELVRENLLGRAFAERALGQFDRGEYAKAAADFKQIMADGAGTRQYRAAEQGLATTYAAMGRTQQAQNLNARLEPGATGEQRNGLEMLHLRDLFKQEAVAADVSKRADLHGQIMQIIRDNQNDKSGWAIAVAAAADYAADPVAEFGATNDGLSNWFLANVLYYKHRSIEAAKYYWAAARSGEYPKAYKYAADLYYVSGRLDMVEQVAQDIARQAGNPDGPWAAYMLYKIPRLQWERSGMRNAQLESQWVTAAQAYLKSYPHGQYAFEPRFRLGEFYQHKGDYLDAAHQYELVAGNPDYDFTARFNAAECYYRAWTAANAPSSATSETTTGKAQAPENNESLRQQTIAALSNAIKLEPTAERGVPSAQRSALHDSRGRAIFMLITLLERQPPIDYQQVASLLDGYEQQYPAMSPHFNEIYTWRLTALDHTARYAALDQQAQILASRALNAARAHADPLSSQAAGAMGRTNDYVKAIGLSLWQSGEAKRDRGDNNGYRENAKAVTIVYSYFEQMVNDKQIPAKNLTGTLSILGQAYLATDQVARAQAIFNQVLAADPGSPDANAGLARIAQAQKDYKDAMDLWSRVESVAAESDSLFYEAKYNIAEIFVQEGNIPSACNKLTATRNEHPGLGSPAMKHQWDQLQDRLCAAHGES